MRHDFESKVDPDGGGVGTRRRSCISIENNVIYPETRQGTCDKVEDQERKSSTVSVGKEGLNTVTVTKIEDVYASLGGYSWFQLWASIVLLLPEIPSSMMCFLPVFTGSNNIRFTCVRQDGSEENVMLGLDMRSYCQNCTILTPPVDEPYFGSIVQEWNLVCERAWLTDTFTSVQMAGMMTGAFVGSLVADKCGRKTCFYFACLLISISGVASGFAMNIYVHAVARYFVGLGVGSYYVVFNIYLIEFLTPNWRTIAGCVSIWCVGEMLLALAAYNIYAWRILTLTISLAPGIHCLTYPLMPESPRWLLCQGRVKDATTALNQIARWNFKNPLDPCVITKLHEGVQAETKGKVIEGSDNDGSDGDHHKKKSHLALILTNPKLCIQLLLFMIGWFSCALVYYGSTFNTKSLSGSPYLNVFWLGLVDMPAFPSGAIFSNWIGRKKTYCAFLMFACIFLVAIVILELTVGLASTPKLITVLSFLARFGIGGAWGIVACFTAESFPTVVRTTCIGICQVAANIGGIIAPQLAYLATISAALPYFIFCGFIAVSALLSWLLKETYGKPLQNFVN